MNHQYKVLCIGVNKVPGKAWKELKYAEKNAAAVAKYFETLKDKADVTLLTGTDADKPNIINWIETCNAAPEEMNVILYFSGRASAKKNKSKKEWQRCLWINSSEPGNTNHDKHRLKLPGILKLLNNPLHNLIVVIDACYRIDSRTPPGKIFKDFEESERFTSLKPYMMISASAVNEYVFEDPALRHGVLTYYFLRTLSGKYSFFLQKKIELFKFLEILDKRVREHRFVTQTGRKRSLPMLMENGVMAHFSSKSIKLPILEPIPRVPDPGKNLVQRKISQLAHFFNCTRLRNKILLMGRNLGIFLLFIYLVHVSMVRIHVVPPQHAAFHNTLLGQRSVSLDNLEAKRFGKKYYHEFSIYQFKHNWVNALLPKLDEEGKIILLGNLLGKRIKGVSEKQLLTFALRRNHDIFYWDPADVMKLLHTIRKEYRNLDINRKRMTLELLIKLGKNGKNTALAISDFRSETHQGLRNLFLEHFYSQYFLARNTNYFNLYDYLYMVKNKIRVPPSVEAKLKKETGKYLGSVVQSISDAHIEITDKIKLSEIYKKLEILATFGSPYFREKALHIFKRTFFPDEVMRLFWQCRNFQDKLWLLELYFKRVQHSNYLDRVWERLVYRHIPNSTVKEKTGILKTIMDTNLELIPKKYWNNLMLQLRNVDPQVVTLTDWENWIQRYSLKLQYIRYIFNWMIEKDYENIFPFIENHYNYFKSSFTGYVFDRLYEFNKKRTLSLLKRIFEIANERDQLGVAVFLYNKNHPRYSAFIVEFLEKAKNNTYKQNLLIEFASLINEAVIKLVNSNKISRSRIKNLLDFSNLSLFYRLFRTNMHFWPEDTIHRVLTSKIPKYYNDDVAYFFAVCERLPEPYRKKMLVKIFKADIDESSRYRAEQLLAQHYPGEFLEIVFNTRYNWENYTKSRVEEAYQKFSFEALKDELTLTLRRKSYWKAGFICKALVRKKHEELNIREIQSILAEFDRPLERIVLRELRYYIHQRQFEDQNHRHFCLRRPETFLKKGFWTSKNFSLKLVSTIICYLSSTYYLLPTNFYFVSLRVTSWLKRGDGFRWR